MLSLGPQQLAIWQPIDSIFALQSCLLVRQESIALARHCPLCLLPQAWYMYNEKRQHFLIYLFHFGFISPSANLQRPSISGDLPFHRSKLHLSKPYNYVLPQLKPGFAAAKLNLQLVGRCGKCRAARLPSDSDPGQAACSEEGRSSDKARLRAGSRSPMVPVCMWHFCANAML